MLWHEHLKRAIKIAAIGGLHYAGILSLIRRTYSKDCAVILMYHRVTPAGTGVQDYSPNGMTVTPLEFETQMRFLRKNYEIVPLSRIVSALRGDWSLPPGSCAITFDDGWRDVYENAFPILRAMSIPATMFLTTGYMGGLKWHWEERARYLLALVHGRRERILTEVAFREIRDQLDASVVSDVLLIRRSRLPAYILSKIRDLKGSRSTLCEKTLQLLELTATAVECGDRGPFMDWTQVREMAQCGIEFGNHTITHPVLLDLPDDQVIDEVCGASAEIQRQIGRRPVNFAYPFGKHEPRVELLIRENGPESACTTRIGVVRAGANVYALNRINISSEVAPNEPLFAGRLLCL